MPTTAIYTAIADCVDGRRKKRPAADREARSREASPHSNQQVGQNGEEAEVIDDRPQLGTLVSVLTIKNSCSNRAHQATTAITAIVVRIVWFDGVSAIGFIQFMVERTAVRIPLKPKDGLHGPPSEESHVSETRHGAPGTPASSNGYCRPKR